MLGLQSIEWNKVGSPRGGGLVNGCDPHVADDAVCVQKVRKRGRIRADPEARNSVRSFRESRNSRGGHHGIPLGAVGPPMAS